MKLLVAFILSIGWIAATVVATMRAIQKYHDTSMVWEGMGKPWYEEAHSAFFTAILAGIGISYCIRKTRAVPTSAAGSSLWRNRVELRLLLYTLAVCWISMLPLNLIKTVRSLRADSFETFWSLFPVVESIFFPATGIAVMVYDRNRIGRDRQDSGFCRQCGYDLRATPDRCPECGTAVIEPEVHRSARE